MFRLLAGVLIAGGVLALMAAAWRGIQSGSLLQNSGKAQGTVIELVEVTGPNNSIAFAPRVSFIRPDGSSGQFVSASAAAPANYTAGQNVTVRYSLRDDSIAEIDNWSSLWGKMVVFIVLGIVLCAIGGITYWLESAGPNALQNLDPFKITGAVFIIVGPLMLLAAAIQVSLTLKFIAGSQTAWGVVERMEIIYAGGASSSFSYYPVVSFQAEGRPVRFVSQTGAYPPAYQEGQQVHIRYVSGFPERARINTFVEIWIGALVSGGMGIIFTALGRLLTGLLASAS